jgi:hypothetical protein
MIDKKARGGQRAGAGRPATLEQPKKITVSLDSPTIALLLSISHKHVRGNPHTSAPVQRSCLTSMNRYDTILVRN